MTRENIGFPEPPEAGSVKIDLEAIIKKLTTGSPDLPDSPVDLLDQSVADQLIDAGKGDIVIYRLNHFRNADHNTIAHKLIQAGNVFGFVNNIDKFQGLDYNEIVNQLIEAGQWGDVAEHLDKFPGLDCNKIADKFIESGLGHLVAKYLDNFQGVDDNEIADRVIKAGDIDTIVYNLYKFKGLNRQIADKLIKAGAADGVAYGIYSFQESDHNEIAHMIIKAGRGQAVAMHLDRFQGLDYNEISNRLIEAGAGWSVADNLKMFHGLNEEIASKLMESGNGEIVARGISSFQESDHNAIAHRLIEVGKISTFIYDLGKFKGLDYNEIARKLIEAGNGKIVIENLDKFLNLDYNEIARKLIEAACVIYVASYLGKFKGLNQQIASQLIEAGEGEAVVEHLNEFQGLDYNDIVRKLIDAGGGFIVTINLGKFPDVNHNEIARELIAAGKSEAVAKCLANFQGLGQEIADELIEAGRGHAVVEHFNKFHELDYNAIARKLIETGEIKDVAENFSHFHELDEDIAYRLIEAGEGEAVALYGSHFRGFNHNEIASRLIRAGQARVISDYFDNFQELSQEIAVSLIDEGYGLDVDENYEKFTLQPEIFELVSKNHLHLSEAIIVHQSQNSANTGMGKQSNFQILSARIPEWQDEQNIAGPFREGAAVFGEERMFKYLDRKGLSRHDGLHQFKKILELADDSGLSSNEFYNSILSQTFKDDAIYDEGTAQHLLNTIASTISLKNFDAITQKAQEYKDIAKLSILLETLKTPQSVCASWKNLKKFKEVIDLLNRTDILVKLKEVKASGNEKLYNYIETLAFHPNIAMERVFEFWQSPESFLNLADSHTPEEVHNRKKPSNYIEFPNLDLSAVELRDALVDGSYDSLQVFEPLVIEYELTEKFPLVQSLSSEIQRALGKRSEGKKGEAQNPNKLFRQFQDLFKSHKLSLNEYFEGKVTLSPEVTEQIERILYGDNGFKINQADIDTYRAKINLKSDPDGVVAGNDTACCMPFGSGKNNVYTFNPVCALFTVQKKRDDGVWRTIAQSVLTKDISIGREIPGVIEQMRANARMQDVIPEDVLSDKEHIIACDNIEVSPNFRSDSDVLETIYRDFFAQYIARFAKRDKLDATRVVIGKGFTDALTNLPQESNTFVPEAPVGYSDKLGDSVYVLSLAGKGRKESQTRIISRQVTEEKITKEGQDDSYLPKGVSPLTFEDALPVSYIEGKAYASNESLIEYLHNMENALIAKDVNNAAKHRPNMSLKYADNKGTMHGYLLAYEGKRDKEGEPVVYISDLASDGSMRAGGALILGFTENYKRHYLDQGKLTPIYAQMREQTSYAIITKQLDKLASGSGMRFNMEEIGTYDVGDDTMHEVMIRPVRE